MSYRQTHGLPEQDQMCGGVCVDQPVGGSCRDKQALGSVTYLLGGWLSSQACSLSVSLSPVSWWKMGQERGERGERPVHRV